MSLIRWRRVSLSFENVSKVTSAFTAHDLSPGHAQSPISVTDDGARDVIIIGGPAASGLEFVVGAI